MSDTGKKKSKTKTSRTKTKNGVRTDSPPQEDLHFNQSDFPPLVTAHTEPEPMTSLPNTPHRAFQAFNDSVEQVNIEDLRDMLPEDTWRDVHPDDRDQNTGCDNLDQTFYDAQEGANAANGFPTQEGLTATNDVAEEDKDTTKEEITPQKGPHKRAFSPSPITPLESELLESTATTTTEPDELELELELELVSAEDCSSGNESLELHHTESVHVHHHSHHSHHSHDASKRSIEEHPYEPKYRFGPAITKRRRSSRVLRGQRMTPSAGGRSYVEAAEALVLGVLDAVRPARPPQQHSDEKGSNERAPEERAVGVLGYMLHTLLSLLYVLFIQQPLALWMAALGVLWTACWAGLRVARRVVRYLWAVYVWWLCLPFRLVQLVAVEAWQRVLTLAVHFLNSAPAVGPAAHSERNSPHKHTIPTAINGHAHHKH